MYLWVKAVHVMAIISWMAGLLYLWRLYVYHAMEAEPVVRSRFEVMERRLLHAITHPAALLALATGATMLVLQPALLDQAFMRAKLVAVALLVLNHVHATVVRLRLLADPQGTSHRVFRLLNEVPTVLMIVIVILVIARPC